MAINIDSRYFWGSLEISNISPIISQNQSVAVSAKVEKLERYIKKYTNEYLEKMFGEELAKDLPSEIESLLYDENTYCSPIANYIWCKFEFDNRVFVTSTGDKKLTTSNSQNVSDGSKYAKNWNEMVDKNIKIQKYLYDQNNLGDVSYLNEIYPYICENDYIFKHESMI